MIHIQENDIILTQLADVAIIDCDRLASLAVKIKGTWVGTLIFEGTIDEITWNTVTDKLQSVSQTTSGNIFAFDVTPYKKFKVRFNPYTSGSAQLDFIGKDSTLSVSSSSGGSGGPATVA